MWASVCIAAAIGIGDGGKSARDAPQPATFEQLSAQLRESKPDRRRSAVRGLAELASDDAWRLVIDALGDPESAVGDAAQLAVAGIVSPKLLDDLLGRGGLESRDESVVVRAAEAIGRSKAGVDGEVLARKLTAREPERSRLLCWSIERLARDRRLVGRTEKVADALEKLADGCGEVELSCAALLALTEVDAARAAKLALDALNDKVPERRCAALHALALRRGPELLAAASSLSADPDPRVRMAAVEAFDAASSRAAMLLLIGRLNEETRLRVRWRIVDVLQSASGLKHRLDPRPWKLWAESLPEGGVLKRLEPDRKGRRGDDGGNATRAGGFAGLQLISDRVAFLFDFSGSMWTALDDGRLPKDLVAVKLREALDGLPESTEFNLIPFTNEPLPWEHEVQPAKKANVARALEFFDACRAKGRGNFYDAALVALADPKVDTLVVLTDGVPTGGFHSDMDLIVPLLLEHARYRKFVVDSILVDAPGGAKRRWEALSHATGGRLLEVAIDTIGASK